MYLLVHCGFSAPASTVSRTLATPYKAFTCSRLQHISGPSGGARHSHVLAFTLRCLCATGHPQATVRDAQQRFSLPQSCSTILFRVLIDFHRLAFESLSVGLREIHAKYRAGAQFAVGLQRPPEPPAQTADDCQPQPVTLV